MPTGDLSKGQAEGLGQRRPTGWETTNELTEKLSGRLTVELTGALTGEQTEVSGQGPSLNASRHRG